MISVDVKIAGLDEMIAMLKQLPDETKLKALRPASREMGMLLRGIAIELSPYRTGALRRNIRILRKDTGQEWKQVYGLRVRTQRRATKRLGVMEGTKKGEQTGNEGQDDPFYWFFVEFGTVHKEAKSFLRAALERNPTEYIESFKQSFSSKLHSLVRKLHAQQRRAVKTFAVQRSQGLRV